MKLAVDTRPVTRSNAIHLNHAKFEADIGIFIVAMIKMQLKRSLNWKRAFKRQATLFIIVLTLLFIGIAALKFSNETLSGKDQISASVTTVRE